jgi:hypothetical protein
MSSRFRKIASFTAAALAVLSIRAAAEGVPKRPRETPDGLEVVDRRHYYLDSWMGAIGLPDDPIKPVVDADGTFWVERGKSSARQGIYPLALYQSPIKIHARLDGTTERVDQRMYSPRVPISIAHKKQGPVAIEETLFLAAPLDWSASVMGEGLKGRDSLPRPRRYLLMTEYTNTGAKPVEITPMLDLQGSPPGPDLDDDTKFEIAWNTVCRTTLPIAGFKSWESAKTMNSPTLAMTPLTIPPGGKARWVLTINRHGFDDFKPVNWAEADQLRKDAIVYWEKSAGLPYGVIQVPDTGIQAIIDTAIRELYQMRYVIKDLSVFLLGPAGYNDYWVFDGSLVTEAADMLGRGTDAGGYADYLLLHQHEDGRIQALTMHWKETGIALKTLFLHARMAQDKEWLRRRWPQFRRAVAAIGKLRRSGSSADPKALNYRLCPEGFGDGGIMIAAEFTSDHWLLAGMKAAVEAARWLGETADLAAWEKEYADFEEAFQKAITRDAKTDAQGNRYIPAVMGPETPDEPSRGQWAFLHGVYPGLIFAKNDPLMLGTMRMLKAHELPDHDGLLADMGWSGIWTGCTSFYAKDWLWLGDGRKAARLQYAIANHASPVWNFCEETPKQSKPGEIIPYAKGGGGDMPDVLNATEFVLLTARLLALDRGQELHLFEGMPQEWLQAGMTTRLDGLGTPFGPLTLELKVAPDGRKASLKIAPISDPTCAKIIVHLGGDVRELAPGKGHEMTLALSK